MAATHGKLPLGVKKLVALTVVILGFLILASGYRYGSFMTVAGGGLLVAIGLAILVVTIARRNRDGDM